MITVPMHTGQGLGNQLWCYAAGRSIAEQSGRAFRLDQPENFKGADFLDNDTQVGEPSSPQSATVCHERQFFDDALKIVCSGFDDRIVHQPGHLRLEGLFQDERYFYGHADRLGRYIRPKPELAASYPVDPDVCVLNIRGGEYKNHPELLIKKSYWENAMAAISAQGKVRRFVMVTDDAAYARHLFPDLPVVSGNVAACFMTILNARHVILSNSSFGYFPTRLGGEKTVIAPMHWARPDNRFDRWVSPANLYEGWTWQSADGSTANHEDLLAKRDATEADYIARCSVLIDRSALPASGWRGLVPQGIRQGAKAVLSRISPSKFG